MGLAGGVGGAWHIIMHCCMVNSRLQADFPQEEVWGGISQLHGDKELPGGPPALPGGFVAPKFWRGM